MRDLTYKQNQGHQQELLASMGYQQGLCQYGVVWIWECHITNLSNPSMGTGPLQCPLHNIGDGTIVSHNVKRYIDRLAVHSFVQPHAHPHHTSHRSWWYDRFLVQLHFSQQLQHRQFHLQ